MLQLCRDALRDLDRLEKWIGRSLMKFNKEKRKVLHQGRNNPMHQRVLGGHQLEAAQQEWAWGSWWTQRWTWANNVPLRQRRLMVSWAALDRVLPAGQGR